MKEKEIIDKILAQLAGIGAWAWVAHKSTGYPQQDIFGCFDIVYIDPYGDPVINFIQATTKHHLSDRRNKIIGAFKKQGIPIPHGCYIWAYDSKAEDFIKEKLVNRE